MFVSFQFLLFLAILWLIYLVIPASKRRMLLLAAGYLFCGAVSVKALAVLALSTLAVYAAAILIEKYRKTAGKTPKREAIPGWIAGGSVLLFAFVLIIVKNIPYAVKMLRIGSVPESHWLRSVVLPVGFSFYAFQAIGYICDVYRGKESAEHDFVSFALYMGFFAKLTSGPIERKGAFSEQLAKLQNINILEGYRLSLAAANLLWGYFLKLVVADRLALIVNEIYAVPDAYDSIWLFFCACCYSFQVYTDFAGYTYIAIGCGELFGIELTQNFKSPYWSENITEFWRRWHISLSSWLRDYVYIPLGGSRKGRVRKCINTVIVFILCGIWHGNGLSFLAWGLLHGFYSVADSFVSKKAAAGRGLRLFLSRTATFLAVTFAWIFFRADSFVLALQYIKRMFTGGIHPLVHIPFFERNGIVMLQVYLSVFLMLLVQSADWISYRKSESLPVWIQQERPVIRYVFFYACIISLFVIGIYGGDFPTEKFIYMRF